MTEADFVRRRRDRVAPEHDPALFATAYSQPVPSPDGRMLAWISDRDGRPHAFVAPLPPDGSAVAEPAWPLPTDGEPGVPWDVQKIAWSPDGFWLACQLAPGGGERTRVRLVTPDGTQVHDLAPSAPAVTLGSWSPSGRQLGITIFGGGTGDGVASLVDVRDGSSTMLTSGPAALVCAISGDGMRAVVRVGRRGARRLELFDLRSGRCTELLPGGEANVADARFGITGGQLFVHSDAGPSGPRCWPSGSTATPRRRCPTSSPPVTSTISTSSRSTPRGRAPRWCGTSRGAVRSISWTCAPASPSRSPARRATSSPRRRSPATGAHSWSGTRADGPADDHPDRAGRGCERSGPCVTRARERAEVTPLLPAAPRDAGHLVDPVLHHFLGEDGLPLSGWLFRPASAFGAVPTHPDLAARRPGGPGTPDLPAAVPGAAGRGRRGVRAERARLRRVRPHVLHADDLRPAVRRDHRRARRVTSLVEHGLADPAASVSRAARTAAT